MNSIFILEFKEDINYLKKKLLSDKNIIVISTNSNISYHLTQNKISFVKLNSFWNQKFDYLSHLKKTLRIPKIIEANFFSIFENFSKYNWNIIDDFLYPIKITYDQLFYYTFCLNKILLKYSISKVYISHNKKIMFSDEYIFSQNQSIIYHLLKSKKKLRIISIKKKYNKYNKNVDNFSFGQVKKKNTFTSEKTLLKTKLSQRNHNIISLSSPEVQVLYNQFVNYKKNIINLNYSANTACETITNKRTNNFVNKLKTNKTLLKFLLMNNFDVSKLFLSQIFHLSLLFEDIFDKFLSYFNIISKMNTKLIIFTTMAPFDNQNIIFKKICNLKDIPKVVWCHGGYCNLHLDGFDITDFKECVNHFSYGQYLKKITNEKNFLPRKIFKLDYKCYNIGSPYINVNFKPQSKKKINEKKIIFIRGEMYQHNQSYFPSYGSIKSEEKPILIEEVLNILKGYQYDYEIIFKDYPNPSDFGLWREYLFNMGFNKIKYISNKKSLNEVLENNQLVILPWLSSTFFHSLPYKNKIFMYDRSLYQKAFSTCNDEIRYFRNKNIFLKSLKLFLKKMDKTTFSLNKKAIKCFLNGNRPDNFRKSFDLAVKNITK